MSDALNQSVDGTDREAGSSAKTTLEIRDLTKIYNDGDGGVLAVDDINVEVKDGEFLVFVGPSGCGKTTTLRCIAGLEEITEGDIIIEDENVSGLEPRERNIAMVFQTYALYPHMTVRENIAYPLKVRGFDKEDRMQRVEETAELLQIPELLDRQPKDLSGGQQQRVALGRALVREPGVFLFDEPLSNLDAKLRVEMRTELNRLHNQIGKTSIYVTHDQAEAMTLGDRIAVMRDAEIQQIAPPQTVYDNPINEFVAGFIGSPQMNFFEGTVRATDGDLTIETDWFEFTLPPSVRESLNRDLDANHDVTFGIRPEDLYIEEQTDRDTLTKNSIESTVIVVEEMGSDFHLTLERDDTEYHGIIDPETDVSRGDRVSVRFDLEKCHLFDAETQESLLYVPSEGS